MFLAEITAHGWISLAVLAASVVLFLSKRVPIPLVALSIPIVLYATGALDEKTAMRGFGNAAALAIAAVFVLGAGLRESGVATLLAKGLDRLAGRSEARLVLLLMGATGLLSAFMSNAAVVAIVLPVGIALSRRSAVAPSRLLMPIAFAAVLGGTITVIGTQPNFLIDDFLRGRGSEGFHVFDFAPVGLAILVTGMLFMALVGRHLLPRVRTEDRFAAARLPADAARNFQFEQRLFKMRVVPQSGLAGQTIAEAEIRARYGASVVVVQRPAPVASRWLEPRPDLEIRPGDVLLVEGPEQAAWALSEEETLQMGLAEAEDVARILGRGTTLAEVTLAPHSRALGRDFKDLDFRKRYDLNVLTVWRRGGTVQGSASDTKLEVGDSFLVSGPAERVRRLIGHPDYIVLTDLSQDEDVTRAPLAVLLLLCALVPPVVWGVPLAISALGAAIAMGATRCISIEALRRAVDWKVIFLIVGTIPLGDALDRHHVAGEAAGLVRAAAEHLGDAGALSALFLLGAVLAVLTSNAAAAVIGAPVALQACAGGAIDVRHALLAMGYGCSCAFLLPFAQCNILVMAPGGYRTRDFVRVGGWTSVVMAATTIVLLSLF